MLGEWAIDRWHIKPPMPAELQEQAAVTEDEDDEPDESGA